MCFSAEASFGLSAMLLPAGVYCVNSAITKNRAFFCLAVIPFVFSVQQFAEGVVWVGLSRSDGAGARVASLIFLAFALAFWPFWIPFCAFLLEPRSKKKWVLGSVAAVGLSGGLTMFLPLLLNPEWLETRPMHDSLYYDMNTSPVFQCVPMAWWQVLYVFVVAVPPMMSRSTGFFLFSVGIVVSATIAQIFFWYASASVWCFFAAVLSLCLCFSFRTMPMANLSETGLPKVSG